MQRAPNPYLQMDKAARGADLSNARLILANLRGASYDADTKWPDEGFNPVAAGAVLVDDMRKDEQDG